MIGQLRISLYGMIFFVNSIFHLYDISAQDYKAIIGGTLINTHPKEIIKDAIILIKDSIIIEAGNKIKGKIPEGTEIINAKGKFIIPGLFDAHIHFFQSGGLYTRPDGLDLRHRIPYSEEVKWIRNNIADVFKRYIRCGITTVIDNGGPFWNFEVRENVKNILIAPRVFVAGPLISSYQPEAFRIDDAPIVQVKSEAEAIELAEKQIQTKTDLLKIWYITDRDTTIKDFEPIAKAVAKIAHKNNIPLFIHATELETAKKVIRTGCNVLVHSIIDREIDAEFLKLAKENRVTIIPTLWVFDSYEAVYSKQLKLSKTEHWLGNPRVIGTLFDMYELDYNELGERQKKLQIEMKPIEPDKIIISNFRKIYEYGIYIAAGTDAGNVGVLHGPALYREFEYMQKAGMANYDILISATYHAAQIINKSNLFGSIEKGKFADLVVLNSNPLDDIRNISDLNFTMKNGTIYHPEEILIYNPEELVQIQLNSYNSRDLETFLSVYSDDVEIYNFPDKLIYKGISQLREVYGKLFAQATKLHCKLMNRVTIGNFVIDKECVETGIPSRDNINSVAIYEIKNNKIIRVDFIKD